ncbi:RNA polymerase sigma-70 factor [Pedobacter caeni]|uniref:RNA polymerase sigma-70 factor, Bacteroides expansion family 1 n=1 Tax=Pedobacter caeni TaxID=288992 RepID=A0A1M5AUM5_9SPHI|nr:RNA polymerase sigma-70 factor [Pedobacter caeni]SHF33777.1 RNA polymerase sigma-70 factor, Bacteroides expansion family 1 [Pedobacter caeni]
MQVKQEYIQLSDLELSSLLSAGDEIAYTEIYNRYHGALYIHVFNKLRHREDSRDIVHDLFISLWNNRDKLVLKTTLSAYLYTAVRYKVFDLISHREVASRYLESVVKFSEQEDGITDYVIREKQFLAIIEQEIAALPKKMRRVFEMSRMGNLSHKEIAAELDLSEKTVKKQINNSLKILRKKLGMAIFTAFIL